MYEVDISKNKKKEKTPLLPVKQWKLEVNHNAFNAMGATCNIEDIDTEPD